MADAHIKITGHDIIMRKLKKMAEPEKFLNPVFKGIVNYTLGEYKRETPKKTGITSKNWEFKKKGNSHYEIMNDEKTIDKKYLIIDILDKGRGEVRPKNKKFLFIPFTERGINAGKGYKQEGMEFGVDFVLAKKSRAVAGLNFISKINKEAGKNLTKAIIGYIRKLT